MQCLHIDNTISYKPCLYLRLEMDTIDSYQLVLYLKLQTETINSYSYFVLRTTDRYNQQLSVSFVLRLSELHKCN